MGDPWASKHLTNSATRGGINALLHPFEIRAGCRSLSARWLADDYQCRSVNSERVALTYQWEALNTSSNDSD